MIKLEDVCEQYYPHITKAERLRKANKQEFPFSVFKLEPDNKRAPYFVHAADLAEVLDKQHELAKSDFTTLHH